MNEPKKTTPPEKVEPILLLEDEPVPGFWVDEMELVPFAKMIAGAAVGTGGPFTIGVFANWGEGKTSVLRQAKTLLDSTQRDLVTVWFNAWQYEKEEHPIVPLTASIVHAIDRKLALSRAKCPTKRAADGLAKIGRALRAVTYGFSAKAKVAVPGFADIEAGFVAKEMIDRYEKLESRDDPLIERTLYYHAFETLETAAGKSGDDGPKIVVFIDDLDRCLPPEGLKLLESIKLVLAQRGFIFVMAVDHRIIEQYLVKRYREEFGIKDYEASSKSYLDKIVQLPLHLPSHRSRFEGYIQRLLERPTFQGTNKPIREVLRQLVDILAVGSDHNPRTLVRFINNLIVDRNIWIAIGEPEEDVDELMDLCAVSRILRNHLGDPLYPFLVRSNELCESLADSDPKSPPEDRPTKSRDEFSQDDRRKDDLKRRFDELPFLRDLLKTDPGHRWLTDPEKREKVNEFLVAQREQPDEETRSSAEIIEAAIRGVLNKPEGVITEADRQSVEYLNLYGTQVSDVSPLSGLTGLQTLHLAGTQVSDVSPLSGLTGLQWLDLRGTQVSNVSPLSRLTGLQTLHLVDTQVSDEAAAALQKALPNCRILH